MSDHLKKHLTTLFGLLDEASCHLQSSITDFVQQIKTRANECEVNSTDPNKAVKDAIAMVTTAQSTILEHTDIFTDSTKLYPPTLMRGKRTTQENECNPETLRRLNDIETALSSLQNTKQKSEDDVSEIKQWRDNFVTKQSDLGIKIEKLSKKQKQNFKNIMKQINEQNNKIDMLFEEIECLKENKSIENMSIDLIYFESKIDKINKQIQGLTDKTGHLSQQIRSHSDLISTIREDGKQNIVFTTDRQAMICKLLQKRLIHIEKMIETFNKKLNTKEQKVQENDVLTLSQDCSTNEDSDLIASDKNETVKQREKERERGVRERANQKVNHSTLGFIASEGSWDGNLRNGYQTITFKSVERNEGNHFDPNTGVFTAPLDGLYVVSFTIKQTGIDTVMAGVRCKSSSGDAWRARVEDSTTFEMWMEAGDMLYSVSAFMDGECTHFSCSFFT